MDEGDLDRGLGWAIAQVGRTAALLVTDLDPLAGTFGRPTRSSTTSSRRTGRLVDPAVWARLLGRVLLEEAMAVGFAAYTRGEQRAEEAAYQHAIDSGHPGIAESAQQALRGLEQSSA